MININILKADKSTWQKSFNTQEDAQEYIEKIKITNEWGYEDKWIDHETKNTTESKVDIDQFGTKKTQYLLPKNYTTEIIDLSTDYNFLLQECYANRIQSYPPMSDYMDALVKGDQTQANTYIEKCKAVKLKYPKPVKK